MKPYEIHRISSPIGLGFVEIDVYEEHHMGAATTRIRPSRPLGAISVFYASGGDAAFTSDSSWLVIYDRKLVLACEWATGSAFHFTPPFAIGGTLLLRRKRPRSLKSLSLGESSVRIRYETAFHTQEEEQELLLGGTRWNAGLGPAANGVFPSAYEPDIRAIRNAT